MTSRPAEELYGSFTINVYIRGCLDDEKAATDSDKWLDEMDAIQASIRGIVAVREARLTERWPGSRIDLIADE